MENATYLAMLRRVLVDTDESAERFTDTELWDATADVVLECGVRGVVQFGSYTVVSADPAGATPVFTDADGLFVIHKVALQLLTALYRDKVSRGELGGSWRSGLEEESTTANQKAYVDALSKLETTITELLLLRAKNVFATRPQ